MAEEIQQWGAGEGDDAAYRSVSVLAVATFALGILSALAWWGPLLWWVPALAVLLGLLGWRSIAASDGTLSGERLLVVGLGLALVSGLGAPTHYWSFRWGVTQEARHVAEQWFTYLAEDQPERAFQLTVPVATRLPPDSDLWAEYRANPALAEELRGFVADPFIKTLLVLGTDAEVRFYGVEATSFAGIPQQLLLIYAITYTDDGQRRTFFASLGMSRFGDSYSGRSYWRVELAQAGVIPQSIRSEMRGDTPLRSGL